MARSGRCRRRPSAMTAAALRAALVAARASAALAPSRAGLDDIVAAGRGRDDQATTSTTERQAIPASARPAAPPTTAPGPMRHVVGLVRAGAHPRLDESPLLRPQIVQPGVGHRRRIDGSASAAAVSSSSEVAITAALTDCSSTRRRPRPGRRPLPAPGSGVVSHLGERSIDADLGSTPRDVRRSIGLRRVVQGDELLEQRAALLVAEVVRLEPLGDDRLGWPFDEGEPRPARRRPPRAGETESAEAELSAVAGATLWLSAARLSRR